MNGQKFYSGGFLFNPKTKKVLLHLRDEKTEVHPNVWAFFGGLCEGKEKPTDTFIREVDEETGMKLKRSSVKFLRDYLNPDFGTHRYVFYAENLGDKPIKLKEGADCNWFDLTEAFKLNLSKRTREDLQYFVSNRF